MPASYPPVDEWFELEIDGDMDPKLVVMKSMVGRDFEPELVYKYKEYPHIASMIRQAADTKFLGPVFPGKRIYRAKLLDLGHVSSRDEAESLAFQKEPVCVLAPGQARDPFAKKFPPLPNGAHKEVAFGGNYWQDKVGTVDGEGINVIAYLQNVGPSRWEFDFRWPHLDFKDCLWLVIEKQDA